MNTPPQPSYVTPALLIEPDPTLAGSFQELLTVGCCAPLNLGMAPSFMEGLAYLRSHQVALILMNLTLPDSPGRDAVNLVHQAANSSALVVYSRPADGSLLLDAIRAGAHEVLQTIPPSVETLSLSIQCALLRAAMPHLASMLPSSALSSLNSPVPLSKVAHDLNNSLTSINGFVDILLARLSADDPSRHCAEQIKQGCEKAEALVKRLSTSPTISSPPHPSDPTNIASTA